MITVFAQWGGRRLARMPLPGVLRLGAGLGWLMGTLVRYRRAFVLDSLRRSFPEKSPAERRAIADGMYRHLGQTMLECLRLTALAPEDLKGLVTLEGAENMQRALAGGRGAIALGGHIGNWELGALAGALAGYPVHAVVKQFRNAKFDAFWQTIRLRFGFNVLPPVHASRACMKILRKNEVVVLIIDQNRPHWHGVFAKFFGRKASTTPGPAYLSSAAGAPVVPIYCRRQPDGHHVLKVLPPLEPPPDRNPETILQATQQYTAILEQIIREQPEQWLWIHNRWKSQIPRLPLQED